MAGSRVRRLGKRGREQASEGGIGSLEGGLGVLGGGHSQLWTNRGKISANVRVVEMVRHQGLRAPKQHARCPSRGTGIGYVLEGNVCNPTIRP